MIFPLINVQHESEIAAHKITLAAKNKCLPCNDINRCDPDHIIQGRRCLSRGLCQSLDLRGFSMEILGCYKFFDSVWVHPYYQTATGWTQNFYIPTSVNDTTSFSKLANHWSSMHMILA